MPYPDPYRSIGGQTFAGGSTDQILKMQRKGMSQRRLMPIASGNVVESEGGQLLPGNSQLRKLGQYGGAFTAPQPMYNPVTVSPLGPPMDSGGGGGRSSGGGGQTSYNPYARNARIGNPGGVMAGPSPPSPEAFAGGLHGFYNNQRQGMGPTDTLQDAAQVDNAMSTMPYASPWRQRFPWAFPQAGQSGQGTDQVPFPTGPAFNPNASFSQFPNQPRSKSDIDPNTPFPTGPDFNPNADFPGRARGGRVGPRPYLVGEKGPEAYVPHNGGPVQMVGANGPEVLRFPADGMIVPNHKLKQAFNTRQGGGQVQGTAEQMSPFAMQYLSQFMPQQQLPAGYENYAYNPDAPSSPWALARYVRMGLQNAARRRSTMDEGRAAVAQVYAQQAQDAPGPYSPALPSPPVSGVTNSYTTPYGNASVSYGSRGVQPRGMFRPLDISGNPAGGIWGDMLPMSADDNDPGQVTWKQANQILSRQKTPLQHMFD